MFDRTIKLIGIEKYDKIKNSNILVLGVGGVGGYAVETLIRSGVENITIVDYDDIDISNINRQIIALNSNIGKSKVEVLKERINDINPLVNVKVIKEKINEDNILSILTDKYDFIIDACDTIIVKKLLLKICHEKNINLITVCGMGKKLNPSLVTVCDILDTSYDPIAKILRKYIKDNHLKGKFPCIFSSETPVKIEDNVVPSMMMVPSTAGIRAAYYCLNKIINNSE